MRPLLYNKLAVSVVLFGVGCTHSPRTQEFLQTQRGGGSGGSKDAGETQSEDPARSGNDAPADAGTRRTKTGDAAAKGGGGSGSSRGGTGGAVASTGGQGTGEQGSGGRGPDKLDIGTGGSGGVGGSNADAGGQLTGGVGGRSPSEVGGAGGTTKCSLTCQEPYHCERLTLGGEGCRGQFADWQPSDSPTTFATNTETAKDSRNGLEWDLELIEVPHNAASADAACTGGARLPTKAELESIVDYTVDYSVSRENSDKTIAIAKAFGEHGGQFYFWTSSPVAGQPDSRWFVNYGGTSIAVPSTGTMDTTRVRCVRERELLQGTSISSHERYENASQDAIRDTRTELVWERKVDATMMVETQAKASAACSSKVDPEADYWQLPCVSELLTLVDPTRRDPAISDKFVTPRSDTTERWYWSSSISGANANYNWRVNFIDGSAEILTDTATNRKGFVRCVHRVSRKDCH